MNELIDSYIANIPKLLREFRKFSNPKKWGKNMIDFAVVETASWLLTIVLFAAAVWKLTRNKKWAQKKCGLNIERNATVLRKVNARQVITLQKLATLKNAHLKHGLNGYNHQSLVYSATSVNATNVLLSTAKNAMLVYV